MGAAIDYLRQRGLIAKANGKRIIVSPASKMTTDVRQYVKANRLELLAELAANDGETRRLRWTVLLADGRQFPMNCTTPTTYTEALADVRGRGCWPGADLLEI